LKKAHSTWLFQKPILEEIAEVLTRPRIKGKYGISEADIMELLTLIEERAEHVLLSGDITVCRDSDDNFVIETAIKGQAAFIITRDDDIKFCKDVFRFLVAIQNTYHFNSEIPGLHGKDVNILWK